MGYRSQRSQGIQASIPDVIVDGTVHMLKVELYEAILAFCAKDEGFGFTTSRLTGWAANFLTFCNSMCRSPRNISRSAPSSTHLGCLPKARRVLGVELEADAKGSLHPLVALFSRLPNVRLLRLSLTNSHAISQELERSDFFGCVYYYSTSKKIIKKLCCITGNVKIPSFAMH